MLNFLLQTQMADKFYADGKIYVVIVVLSTVLIGLAIYLFRIDRKISKIEEEIDNNL